MSTALCSFTYLVSARTDALPITEQAFRHLAELPHLEAIDICLDTITEASFNRARFDEFFPNLRELRLSHSFSLGLISLVVQCVKSPRLEIIGARLLDDDVFVPLDTAMSLFSAIFSVKNSERIQELEIEATIEGTITAQHLEPLFALRRLTSLQLHLQCTFDLDDEVLGRAARAWRNIRVLELGPFAPQWKTSVTLTVLVAFAQHCPKLQTLGLTIDAAHLSYVHYEYWYEQVHAACVQRELRVLNVGRACITDPGSVGMFLIDLFPRLNVVQHTNFTFSAKTFYRVGIRPDDELGLEVVCRNCWDEVRKELIPALARERGLEADREWTLDEVDAHVTKAAHFLR